MPSSLPESLSQWLSFIEAAHPAEIELGLERSRLVADALQLRQGWNCPIVTLAGTNGKGSTQAYISQIMAEHGYQVASYSSPHLLRYNERVCLNGVPTSDEQLCDAFAAVEQARHQLDVTLTYFEFGTLAALWLFQQWQPDLVLLEVGLGGRLDSVNIIDPDISVITTVALDHQGWLGNDRESVGFEKAGILREGVPFVYGELDMPACVLAHAQSLNCPLYHWGDDFGPKGESEGWSWFGVSAQGQSLDYGQLPLPELPFENAATALQTISLLPMNVNETAIRVGLKRAMLAGRRQRLPLDGRELLLDVAHNPHAAAYLVRRLSPIAGKTWCVLGMLQDKDCSQTITALAPAVDEWLLADLSVPRGCHADQLLSELPSGQQALCYHSPWVACQAALEKSQPGDRILIVGSFFTVADILQSLQEQQG
ncbi:MAG: bifunctional tetrahydrofolate synthase/dihydrofolate synthase [Halopseudomonas sp.]